MYIICTIMYYPYQTEWKTVSLKIIKKIQVTLPCGGSGDGPGLTIGLWPWYLKASTGFRRWRKWSILYWNGWEAVFDQWWNVQYQSTIMMLLMMMVIIVIILMMMVVSTSSPPHLSEALPQCGAATQLQRCMDAAWQCQQRRAKAHRQGIRLAVISSVAPKKV